MEYKKSTQVKKELNLLTTITKRAIIDFNHSTYNKLIQSLSTRNNSLWHFTTKCSKKENNYTTTAKHTYRQKIRTSRESRSSGRSL